MRIKPFKMLYTFFLDSRLRGNDKKDKLYCLLFCFLAFLFLLASPVKAEESSITIRLQIKTHDASLYDQDITVTACADSPTASTTTVNAKCALEQSGLTSDWSWWGQDAFLNSIGSYINNDGGNGVYWGWFGNLEYGQVALNRHQLIDGENLLLTYNVNPLKISLDNASPFVNATTTITAEQFGLDASWNPVWLPAASSTLVIDGQETENSSGTYEYRPLSAGPKIIYAKKNGFLDSASVMIMLIELATSTIRLQIKTHDTSLYDAEIIVTACADSPTATTTTVNAKCALEQSGLTSDWSWWGQDAFLNSIGSYINNDGGNGVYWGWFGNLEYGQVALNRHQLIDGENLLLTYNVNPLKISLDNASPFVNATTTITAEQFGLDASWNPVWLPAASSTLVIDGQAVANDSGTYIYIATTTGEHIVYASKAGYVASDSITVMAQAAPENDEISSTPPANSSPTGGSVIPTSGGGSTSVPLKVDLVKAVDFLNLKQSADGSFGSIMVTDWVAVALGSFNQNSPASQKLRSYLAVDPDPLGGGLNPVSDYARRAMALMSLNISPYDGARTNYIKKIVDLFDGRQFGDSSLYNDDIFALLVLSKAGYSASEEIIKQTIAFILSQQQSDGSWIGVDLTAAAIQALTPFNDIAGVGSALDKGKNFLLQAQGEDGGFGNIFATAWVRQAMAALGLNDASWPKNGKTPESFLALSQASDGGLDKDSSIETNRVWATAYAIPAVQGKSWLNVLNNFSKQDISTAESAGTGGLGLNNLTVATSSQSLLGTATSTNEWLASSTPSGQATSTPDLATSTLDFFSRATSTEKLNLATSMQPIAEQKKAKLPPKPAKPVVLGKKIVKDISRPITDSRENEKPVEQKISAVLSPPQAENKPELSNKQEQSQKVKKVLLIAGAGTIVAGLLLILKLLGILL